MEGLVYPAGSTRRVLTGGKRYDPLPPHGYRVCSALVRGGSWRAVRTPGPCDGCGDWFNPGDPYLDTGLRKHPEMATYRLCISCAYAGAYGV